MIPNKYFTSFVQCIRSCLCRCNSNSCFTIVYQYRCRAKICCTILASSTRTSKSYGHTRTTCYSCLRKSACYRIRIFIYRKRHIKWASNHRGYFTSCRNYRRRIIILPSPYIFIKLPYPCRYSWRKK